MTWQTTYFIRWTSSDGKRTGIQKSRRLHAYYHPAQYRETMLDDDGRPLSIQITDYRAERSLWIDMRTRKATLKHPVDERDDRPPFAMVGDIIRERKTGGDARVKALSLRGQKTIGGVQATVVRATIEELQGQSDRRIDFLFDVSSKRLVGIWQPEEPDLEFETLVDQPEGAPESRSLSLPVGMLIHNIVIDPPLQTSLFNLDPPADFEFERLAKPTVTEPEMIGYLGAAARFNDNVFPDSPYVAFDPDKFNAESMKEASDRTQVAQALIDRRDQIMRREIYQPPVRRFEADHTVPGSFHYVGSGVRLGAADQLVAWYQLRRGGQYRALYGDLSVKDVRAKDLPIRLP